MAGRVTAGVIQGSFVGGQPRRTYAAPGGPRPAHRPQPGPPPPAYVRAPTVQRAAAAAGGPIEIDARAVGLSTGGGRPLPQALMARMEAAFGADFSAVRVHEGPQAQRIGAVAFTLGEQLYFAPGRFQPDTPAGQRLIGHELAHVIQQRQGRVRAPGPGVAIVQDHALEAEADRLALRALQTPRTLPGAPAQRRAAGAPSRSVQRWSAPPRPRAIQRAMGMEIELGVSVLTAKGEKIPGKTDLLTGPHYTITTDSSARAGKIGFQESASNVEIVVHHFDEHADGAERTLEARLAEVSKFVDTLSRLTGAFSRETDVATLGQSLGLATPPRTHHSLAAARINVALPGASSLKSLGFVHFTVAAELGRMSKLIDWASTRTEWTDEAWNKPRAPELIPAASRAAKGATIAPSFGKALAGLTPAEQDELDGYLRLMFMQARALDGGGLLKNNTTVLSRVDVGALKAMLSPNVLAFVNTKAEVIKGKMKRRLGVGAGVSLMAVDAWLAGKTGVKVSQQKLFGEMKTLAPEAVGRAGRLGVPVELRHAGPTKYLDRKGWEEAAWHLFYSSRAWHGRVREPVDEIALSPEGDFDDYLRARAHAEWMTEQSFKWGL
jgi:hypothetical protein